MNLAASFGQFDIHRIFPGVGRFFGDTEQPSFPCAGFGNAHGNTHGGPIGAIDPGVISNGKGQMHRFAQMFFQHPPVEGLGDAVGGNQAKTLDFSGGQQGCGVMPPEHDQIRRFADLRVRLPQSIHVAIPQGAAHGGRTDEGRIAHHHIGLGPMSGLRIQVADLFAGRRFIRDCLAGCRMGFHRPDIPDAHRISFAIGHGFGAAVLQYGIPAFDVFEIPENRRGRQDIPVGFVMPLQVANP